VRRISPPEIPADAIPTAADWSRGLVELTDIGHSSLRQPNLAMALAELSPGRRVVGSIAALAGLLAAERPGPPAGVIFHTGRCGSTLLANMLGAHPDLRVLKEPEIVNELLLHRAETSGAGTCDPDLRTLLLGFSRGLPAKRRAIVKCTSWNAADANRILAAVPETRAVFLWRPAVDVVASSVASPPGWCGQAGPVSLLKRWIPSFPVCGPGRHEFYAAAWVAVVTAGLNAAMRHPGRVTFMSYDALRARPGHVAAAVAAHLGAASRPAVAESMAELARVYAKDPQGRAAFAAGQAHARPALPACDASRVAGLTGPAEQAIREITAAGSCADWATRPGGPLQHRPAGSPDG
jgi:hypothetical protein